MTSNDDLTTRREGLGLSRKDAAVLAGVKQSVITAVEQGRIPRNGGDEQYTEWLDAAEKRSAASAADALPFLKFKPELHGAEPMSDHAGDLFEGVWAMPDKGFGLRIVVLEPTADVCDKLAGWSPGRRFRVDSEEGTFMFQRLVINVTTGTYTVDAHGGRGPYSAFRSFEPDRIVG